MRLLLSFVTGCASQSLTSPITLGSESDVPLSDLIRLAHEHEELYPKLVDTVKKYIKVFERKDVDE